MSAILNSLNAHNFPIFQPILMKLVSKFMVYRALCDKTYLLSGLLSPLNQSVSRHHRKLFFFLVIARQFCGVQSTYWV